MDDTGASNTSTVSIAMSKLLLNSLADKPSEAVLFMPIDERMDQRSLSAPLRISELSVDQQSRSMTLTVAPMSHDQRAALFQAIREPLAQ